MVYSISIGNAVFSFFGDLHTGYFESYYSVILNKTIQKNLNLEDPYELVRNGTWTLDKMIDMMMAAQSDTDGDGKWTIADQYPMTMYEAGSSILFLLTGTAEVVNKDAENMPVWSGLDEQILSIYDKMVTTIFSKKTNNGGYASGKVEGCGLEQYRAVFLIGKALTLVTPVGVLKDMRDVDFELGVVPMAKYEESQEKYRTFIFAGANAISVFGLCSDYERAGNVLEHMAAYSHETVKEVYFNTTLDFKYIQDQESQEMLDIVFENGIFDLASVYGWGGVSNVIMTQMNAGKAEIVSKVQEVYTKVETDIQSTLDALEALTAE